MKTFFFFISVLLMPVLADAGVVLNTLTTNANPSFGIQSAGGQVYSTNFLTVAPNGILATAARNGAPYPNLSSAVSNALNFDTIYVNGITSDTNMCVFTSQSNAIIFNNAARINYNGGSFNGGSYDSFCYLKFVNGLRVYYADIEPVDFGHYSTVTGPFTNGVGTTNVLFYGCKLVGVADTIYDRSAKLQKNVVFDSCWLESQYDMFATFNSSGFISNPNSDYTFKNCDVVLNTNWGSSIGDKACFRNNGASVSVLISRIHASNTGTSVVHSFVNDAYTSSKLTTLNNILYVETNSAATSYDDFTLLGGFGDPINTTAGGNLRTDGQQLVFNNAGFETILFLPSAFGALSFPMADVNSGQWLMLPATDGNGSFMITNAPTPTGGNPAMLFAFANPSAGTINFGGGAVLSGNGNSFTNLNASSLASGSVLPARLDGVNLNLGIVNAASGTFTNTFTNRGTVYLPTNTAPFATASNPTNQFTTGVIYTNLPMQTVLRGAAVLTGATAGTANITLWHTNNGIGYPVPMQQGAGLAFTSGTMITFFEPMSPNDTFQFVAAMGTGASGYITNVVLWKVP